MFYRTLGITGLMLCAAGNGLALDPFKDDPADIQRQIRRRIDEYFVKIYPEKLRETLDTNRPVIMLYSKDFSFARPNQQAPSITWSYHVKQVPLDPVNEKKARDELISMLATVLFGYSPAEGVPTLLDQKNWLKLRETENAFSFPQIVDKKESAVVERYETLYAAYPWISYYPGWSWGPAYYPYYYWPRYYPGLYAPVSAWYYPYGWYPWGWYFPYTWYSWGSYYPYGWFYPQTYLWYIGRVDSPNAVQKQSVVSVSTLRPALLRNEEVKKYSAVDAPSFYNRGIDAFISNRFAEAKDYFERATRLNEKEPKYWYYLAVTNWSLGNSAAGTDAAKVGAAMEMSGGGSRSDINVALERVQGTMRQLLEESINTVPDRKAATELLAARAERKKAETLLTMGSTKTKGNR